MVFNRARKENINLRKSKNFLIQNLILEKLFFGIYIEKSRDESLKSLNISG